MQTGSYLIASPRVILFWGTPTFFEYVVVVDFYPHRTVSEHDCSEIVDCAHLVMVISGGIDASTDMTMIHDQAISRYMPVIRSDGFHLPNTCRSVQMARRQLPTWHMSNPLLKSNLSSSSQRPAIYPTLPVPQSYPPPPACPYQR
jgi:hypothetical protein